ncbi:MAG: PRC-barrel domain-containing protein [Candidatus Odinarchaeota archaeon]
MKVGESLSFTQLKKKQVVDKDGVTVGKNLIDVVFSPSLVMSHLIAGGGFLEETLEKVRLKDDIDPIFSFKHHIAEIKKNIKLTVKKDDVPALLKGIGIPEGHVKLSELSKMDVIDKNGVKIGNVIDVAFFKGDDDCMSFVIGGSFLEEFLEKVKLIPDVDILVPSQNITGVKDNKITLDLSREELKTTVQEDNMKGADLKKANFQDYRMKVALINHQSLLK